METLQLILFEYILGYGLQAFVIIFGIYTFNGQKIEINKYIFTSIMIAIVSFLVRQLPISFGIHTIFNMLASIIICIVLLKMPAIKVIRSISIVYVLLIVSELLGLVAISILIGEDEVGNLMTNPLHKAILSVPFNIFFLLLVSLFYIY